MMTLEGKWNLVIKTPFGEQKLIAELSKASANYSGTLANEQGVFPLSAAAFQGDEAKFEGAVKTPMGELKLSFHGVVTSDNKIFGKCKTMFGESNFSGARANA